MARSGGCIHAEHVPDRKGIYGIKHFVLAFDPLCDSNARTLRKNLPAPSYEFQVFCLGVVCDRNRLDGVGVWQE